MASAAELPKFRPRDTTDPQAGRQGFPLAAGSSPVSTPVSIGERGRNSSLFHSSLGEGRLDSIYQSMSDALAACAPYFQASAKRVQKFNTRIREMKEHKPLQLLGVVAGSAFVLGMVVRLWRSR